ncbi:hypothetical protein BD414DRAFT_498983 [Trametes punicea]|nr:hypothetical protein BD414DRAFT_498983 [Trametes punicea]
MDDGDGEPIVRGEGEGWVRGHAGKAGVVDGVARRTETVLCSCLRLCCSLYKPQLAALVPSSHLSCPPAQSQPSHTMSAAVELSTTPSSHSLPPTSNTLDARQRTRLIRSTRKLGDVLGTTPHLEEQPSPFIPSILPIAGGRPGSPVRKTSTHAKRRHGSIFELPNPSPSPCYDSSSSASSSVSSLSLSRSSLESTTSVDSTPNIPPARSFTRHVREKSRSKGKQAPLPTPLVLRLNAVPLPPSDPRVQPPITPDTAATVTFASLSSASMLPATPTTPLTPTVTETRRKRVAKLKRTLGENVPIELVLPLRPAHPRRRSASPSPTTPSSESKSSSPFPAPLPRLHDASQTKAIYPRATEHASRRRSLSVDLQQAMPDPEHRSSRVWVTGNGNWTGEWNRRDIREVQQQLRALRAR